MKKILCIGDSNTYGYDPRARFGSRYPADIRWTDRLDGFEVINNGVNGMTIPRKYSVYTDLIRSKEPDLVIVMLGSNDLLQGAGAGQTAERMEAFIAAVSETGIPVMLIAPPHMKYGDWVDNSDLIQGSRNLGTLYRELAVRADCQFVDAGEWGVDLTYDGVHFSPEGHAVFAQRLESILKR